MRMAKTAGAGERFASVCDAIADTAEEAANLRLRSEWMHKIGALLEAQGWTQSQAARRCSVNEPRINDLLRWRASRLSLDALVNIAAALEQRLHVEFEAA